MRTFVLSILKILRNFIFLLLISFTLSYIFLTAGAIVLQMARRGRSKGLGQGQSADAEPAVDHETGLEQIPRIVADLLAPFAARMDAFFAAGTPPTPPAPVTPVPEVTAGVAAVPKAAAAEQEAWMRLIERYQKLRAPDFAGVPDPLVADKWKEDVGNVLSLMGVDPIQRQRLAAFSLKGDARKWYRAQFSEMDRLTVGWEEFAWRFD